MNIDFHLVGITPLLMHNERLSDANDPIVREIKTYTAKKKNQTDADKEIISMLEWRGGIYTDAKGEVVVPVANFVRCLREAATITKRGKHIARAILYRGMSTSLILPAGESRKVDDLIKIDVHHDRRQVKVGSARITRVRPIFQAWALQINCELLEDVLDFDELASIADVAGRSIGLGDARILGYGRFTSKLAPAMAIAA